MWVRHRLRLRDVPIRIVASFVLLVAVLYARGAGTMPVGADTATYTNPLTLRGEKGPVESCPDPAVIRSQRPGDSAWYLYCTTEPGSGGQPALHLIPILQSRDLVHWSYLGDALAARPSWATTRSSLWAPDIQFFNDRYYLYYTVTNTTLPDGGSAIGVATSDSPVGPWTDSGAPVVEPHVAACCPDARAQVFDPTVIADERGDRFLFYGSYRGGVAARPLSADGLHTDPVSETPIAVAHRYEGASVVRRNGFYYLFVSATNCCNGALTGYSVFVGRAASVLGPYTDRTGASLLDAAVGGTPVLSMNGNRWVGAGHNTVLTDAAGQDWMLYHAVDRNAPYFTEYARLTKRPALLDPLDWRDGWPTVRGGLGPSDTPHPVPAAQSGDKETYVSRAPSEEAAGVAVPSLSVDFAQQPLARDVPLLGQSGRQWGWVRPPDPAAFGIGDGALHIATQSGDLYGGTNSASVLTEPTPDGDYAVETRIRLDVPPDGCCHNFVQAGLVIYGDDDNYVKLVTGAQWETRQTEFAKEIRPTQPGFPRYGNMAVGPSGAVTYLRIVKHRLGSEESYTAYTSRDGALWDRGGTWTHTLGADARIGLVAMGGVGFTAKFDYVRVFTLPPLRDASP